MAVPDQLTICGFDDGEIGLGFPAQVTAVRQPIGEMARWAVRQLVSELTAVKSGVEPSVRKVVLNHTVMHRGSDTAPPDQPTGKKE